MTDFKVGDEVRVKPKGLVNVKRAARRDAKIIQIEAGAVFHVEFRVPITNDEGLDSKVWYASRDEIELVKTEKLKTVLAPLSNEAMKSALFGGEGVKAIDTQEGGSHYKDMAIQPIEYIMANNIPFAEGNVIKYTSRWRKKGGVADLRKARHMLDVIIEEEEKKLHAAQ